MNVLTNQHFNELVSTIAKRQGVAEAEIRVTLTDEALAEVGYRKETLVKQITREGALARENMVFEHLREKSLV